MTILETNNLLSRYVAIIFNGIRNKIEQINNPDEPISNVTDFPNNEMDFYIFNFNFKIIASINPFNEKVIIRTYRIERDANNILKHTSEQLKQLEFDMKLNKVAFRIIPDAYTCDFIDGGTMVPRTYWEKLEEYLIKTSI